MSGWDAQFLAGKTFGLLLVTGGLLQLLAPLAIREDDRRASEWRLRYGYGGMDVRRVEKVPRWPAFVMIGAGSLYLFLPGFAGRMNPVLLIVMGGLYLFLVLSDLLAGSWFAARRLRRYEAKLARVAEDAGPESDALRAVLANPPVEVSPRRRWLINGLFLFFGGAFLALGLAYPR